MRIAGYDERAVQYVRRCLSGGLTLAKSLSRREIPEDGITCFLPHDLEAARKHDFKVGGISSHATGIAELAVLVQDHLQISNHSAAVIEDQFMTLDSKSLSGLPFVHFDKEIYQLLGHEQAWNDDLVIDSLKTGSDYPFIMVLTQDTGTKANGSAIGSAILDQWANGASYIIVGVYDGESYLICRVL